MRAVLRILGAMLIATGVVWVLQGVNVLKGSFMTGQAFWAWMGVLAIAIGLPLSLGGLRRRAR